MEKKIVLNNNGIRIVTCCASCQFKEYSSCKGRLFRICKKHNVEVKGGDICDDWQISSDVRNEGKLGKKPTYEKESEKQDVSFNNSEIEL